MLIDLITFYGGKFLQDFKIDLFVALADLEAFISDEKHGERERQLKS